LWEAAKEEEMRIPWKEGSEESPVSEEQYQERFWRRRLDGIGLDTVNKVILAGCLAVAEFAVSPFICRDILENSKPGKRPVEMVVSPSRQNALFNYSQKKKRSNARRPVWESVTCMPLVLTALAPLLA
jgi:hypothetical protein